MIPKPTGTKYVRHTFTDGELLEISRRMAQSQAQIREREDELKTAASTIKAEIAELEARMSQCGEYLRSGYMMKPKECYLEYSKTTVKYVDKETGEIIEERPMTEDEQLQLTGQRTDAEVLIRRDNDEGE